MAYYNYRITGNALQIPFLLHEQTYGMSAHFIWQRLPPKPIFRHKIIEDFHAQYELPVYYEKHSIAGFFKINFAAMMMYLLVAGSVFTIPLIGSAREILSWSWNSRWGRFALSIYVFFILGMMLETYLSPHYFAPITALNYFFVLQGIRLWRARDHRVGKLVLLLLPFLALTVLAINTYQSMAAHNDFAPALQRARLLKQLNQRKDQHLILVTYGPNHSYHKEWVYNEADIDGSKVVWARDMGLKENCKLIEYFKGRMVWSLEIDHDEAPIKLNHFSEQSCHEVVS
jgi:hypothetical protein